MEKYMEKVATAFSNQVERTWDYHIVKSISFDEDWLVFQIYSPSDTCTLYTGVVKYDSVENLFSFHWDITNVMPMESHKKMYQMFDTEMINYGTMPALITEFEYGLNKLCDMVDQLTFYRRKDEKNGRYAIRSSELRNTIPTESN